MDTSTGLVIADTSVRSPIVKAPLVRNGPWPGAAGPVRSIVPVAFGTSNANHWSIEVSSAAAQPFTRPLLLQALALVLMVTGLLAAVAQHFGNGISRPVRHVTEVAEAMGAGDLSHRTAVHRNDEIGRMATAINQAIDVMSQQQDRLHEEFEVRQEQLRNTRAQQQRAHDDIRTRAQTVIDETAASVQTELKQLLDQVHQVQAGAAAIDDRVIGTGTATRALVEQAANANGWSPHCARACAGSAGSPSSSPQSRPRPTCWP